MNGQLAIQNFKCFRAAEIPLGGLTIVTGGNGMGKSTIIQSLLLLRQTADQVRQHSVVGGDTRSLQIHLNGPYELSLGNSLTLTNAEIESDRVRIAYTPNGGASIGATLSASTTVPRTTLQLVEGTDGLFGPTDHVGLLSPEFYYLVAERVGPRDLYPAVDQEYVSTGLRGEATANAIAQSESATVASGLRLGEDQSSLFKVQLERWMRTLIPSVQFVPVRYPEINKVRMGIAKEGSAIPALQPTNTGFGISYSLPIVVSGLLAKSGSALIVENPEAHLHPAAQSALGYFLACVSSGGVGVVVETHSEHVVNGVRLAVADGNTEASDVQVLFLSSGESTQPVVKPIAVTRTGDLEHWPSGFFDQQSTDLRRLLRQRHNLRGPTEE